MDGRNRTFLLLQICFCFFVFASTEETKQMKRVSQEQIEDCSQVQCPGPLAYYEEVGCTPVYKKEGDCCAYKYNCDHLDARSPNKCYIKNRSYEIGEYVSREDIKVCDVTCVCGANRNSTGLWCSYSRYQYNPPIGPTCYLKRNIHQCDLGTITCPQNVSEISHCHVNGRRYMTGELFTPGDEPGKWCMCQEGYKGDNIEPFCITTIGRCNIDLYYNKEIANKNAPVYDEITSPATGCTSFWSRQHPNDTVIPNPNGPTASGENSSGGEGLTCKIGNLTMNIGDELNQTGGYYFGCVRCVCEVPPTPTCKSLYRSDCYSASSDRF